MHAFDVGTHVGVVKWMRKHRKQCIRRVADTSEVMAAFERYEIWCH